MTLSCAALSTAATGAITATESGFAGARVQRAARVTFSIAVALVGALEVSLAAALAVTRSLAGTGHEIRVRREQTRCEENGNGTPS
jgi:hypothetical protein